MTYIHPTAVIGPNVRIGEGTYIGPYCVIGFPAEHKGNWPNDGFVEIGCDCVITGHVTIDSSTGIEPTFIGNRVWMMKHSHVGHDAVIFSDTVISCGAKIGGHAIVKEKNNIGLNAVIHQRKIIPEGCMIGMGAVVTKATDMKPYRKYAGVPAKDIGENFPK